MKNRIFFPQASLDEWLIDDAVTIEGTTLTFIADRRSNLMAEAVRVLCELTGERDTSELVGKVKSRIYVQELGAELLEGSMVLGDLAYDIVTGWVGSPTQTAGASDGGGDGERLTDEQALAALVNARA